MGSMKCDCGQQLDESMKFIDKSKEGGYTVQASESGVVVHASNKLQGYGNLVLIKHQNGWVTGR